MDLKKIAAAVRGAREELSCASPAELPGIERGIERVALLISDQLEGAERNEFLKACDAPGVVDFCVDNHGSILILNANTEAAREWVEAHLPEDRQTWGKIGTVVEPRYIGDIVAGIEGDGLSVE